jgi:hypothetical protein
VNTCEFIRFGGLQQCGMQIKTRFYQKLPKISIQFFPNIALFDFAEIWDKVEMNPGDSLQI